jgi:hypothetical protein
MMIAVRARLGGRRSPFVRARCGAHSREHTRTTTDHDRHAETTISAGRGT